MSRCEFPFLGPPQAPGELGRLAHFLIQKQLGRGGMGIVFQAFDMSRRCPVALKVIQPRWLEDREQARPRFQREARALALLHHENIVHVFEASDDHEPPYIAMELLSGQSFQALLDQGTQFTLPQVLRIGRETAEGLAAAHLQGVLHRDLKPSNLWQEPSGRVKILDFGLAYVHGADDPLPPLSTLLGTPQWMAPEQAGQQQVRDPRCDVFNLGLLLYRLCTRQDPFAGDPYLAMIAPDQYYEVARPVWELNPQVPERFAELIHRMLSRTVDGRPTAAEVARELGDIHRQWLAQPTAGVLPPPAAPADALPRRPTGRRPRRMSRPPWLRRAGTPSHPTPSAMAWVNGAMVVVALLIGLGLWLARSLPGPAQVRAVEMASPSGLVQVVLGGVGVLLGLILLRVVARDWWGDNDGG